MCDRKIKCIERVAIGMVLLGLILLLAGCWSTEEPPTASEVEDYLKKRYGEEFQVIKQEELPIGSVYNEIEGYQVCPVSNPELTFGVMYFAYNRAPGGSILPEYASMLYSTYEHVILREAILDWLDREGWDYEVNYIGDYVFGKGGGKEGPYTTKASIYVHVEDIESAREKIAEQLAGVLHVHVEDIESAREKIAEQLEGVLQELMSPDRKGVQLKNKRYYEVRLLLKDDFGTEKIYLIGGDEELDITKAGLIEEFKENRH